MPYETGLQGTRNPRRRRQILNKGPKNVSILVSWCLAAPKRLVLYGTENARRSVFWEPKMRVKVLQCLGGPKRQYAVFFGAAIRARRPAFGLGSKTSVRCVFWAPPNAREDQLLVLRPAFGPKGGQWCTGRCDVLGSSKEPPPAPFYTCAIVGVPVSG